MESEKKSWNGTKTEFARFVQEIYEKNRGNYKSLKKASEVIFNEYIFEDKKWTKEKCYDLVRKN